MSLATLSLERIVSFIKDLSILAFKDLGWIGLGIIVGFISRFLGQHGYRSSSNGLGGTSLKGLNSPFKASYQGIISGIIFFICSYFYEYDDIFNICFGANISMVIISFILIKVWYD